MRNVERAAGGPKALHAADAPLVASMRPQLMWAAPGGKSRAMPADDSIDSRLNGGNRRLLGLDRKMAVIAFAQLRFQELAGCSMRQTVDENDVVWNLPLRQLAAKEVED